MKINKYAFMILGCTIILAACSDSGSDDPMPPGGGLDQTPPADMATSWTIDGTIEFPVGETASNLKLWARQGVVTTTLVSDIVSVIPAGNPPMASFTLSVDVSGVAQDANTKVDLYVFNDEDGNDLQGLTEGWRLLAPIDVSCLVWANGMTKSSLANFKYYLAGSSGTTQTSWYFPNCSAENDCLTRITTGSNTLSGAKLGYSSGLGTPLPIQP